jgi:hypothetical protein
MPATYATDGAINNAQAGNDIGGASTGIGIGANHAGVAPRAFVDNVADQLAWHIGGGDNVAGSASNTGPILQVPVTVTAGSGYTNGTYRVQSTGGGAPDGSAEVEFVITAGALASARVVRAGAKFTSAPTFTVANAKNVQDGTGPGAGTLGALIVSVGLLSQIYALGAAFGANKNTQSLTATGAVAINAAVTPSTYLNRSGRAMVAGEAVWAVEP